MRTIVVSGASSGIGKATAERFLGSGDYVVNLDAVPPEEAGGLDRRWIETDVADWGAVRDALARVHDERGRLDVVVANAGISKRRGVLDLAEEDVRRIVDVNLLGVLALWRHAAEYMVRQGHGVLLATASVNGSRGYPLYADYNATKAGVVSLCQTFAMELSPRVRTACVTPGAVLTPMQRAEYTDEMLAEVNARIPARRHAAPEEIAEAFFFLASDAAAFVTGQEFVIDGGETAGATTAFFPDTRS
ncbi:MULTISPECIES: SDR family oxidoreductase [unclassified Streptomyces]|uniref:SDR family NAD(P)-dependent oxidoreductase n=1 Tax=unclassified Streptomyces TaxID=2593676 RepID=UPI002E15FEF1|nr:SDR family oxidoreductase [Streptomyces sp. NBC_01197]WSS47256.1 SDR family oxidoreductase [Streptomyces sp. NBC_01180]